MQRSAAYLSLLAGVPALFAAESATNRFGFTGPEIFPIDNQIEQLRAADINGDGKTDLILVNNSRAKINILLNRTGETNAAAAEKNVKRELNELPPDARFKIDSIASEKRIAALLVTDLNADGKPDIAYYGEPKELVVQYNQGTNAWSTPKRWEVGDATSLSVNSLTMGDLNGDKRTDILLLTESHILFFAQNADHTLADPEKISYSGTLKAVQVMDVNGDGRDDLLLVNWDDPNPFRFRLQNADGQLGPEFYFNLPPVRAYWADDLDGDHKTEIVTIAQNSGRAQIFNFARKEAEAFGDRFQQGQFQIFALNKTGKARRGLLWADVNGDGRTDLVGAEPDSGQLSVYLQKEDGSLASARLFPTFTGVSDLAVADWDGDGKPEIFLLSADERQIGVTRYDENGRVAFPTVLPLEGKPLAFTVGKLAPQDKPVLAVISDLETNRVFLTRTADGKIQKQKLADAFKSNPASLTFHDVDQDGLADLVVLVPYEKIKVLRQVAGKDFEEVDIVPPGGNSEQPWLSISDVDGDGKDELLLAQKNFLRAVVMKKDVAAQTDTNKTAWAFDVREQINGAASNSRIVGAAPLRGSGDKVPSLFLLDAEKKALTLCARDTNGVWSVVRNVNLPVVDFNALQAVGFGSSTPNAIAFTGLNAVAWLNLSGQIWELQELDSYETPIKDGRLNDLVSGDLNHDKRKDLVFLETAKNYVDLVTFEPPHQLSPANRWPVFEERTFRSRRGDMPEPREAVVTDVTGDGKNDLIILVHDRLLVYPQE